MSNRIAIAIALAAVAGAAATARADVLANWTFETSIPATAGPFAAEAGNNAATSFASGVHASASTYSSPSGNGSLHSFSSNTWAVGDYYQFTTSTVGYTGISIQWDQTSSNTGPRDFRLSWSTDGSTFTALATATVLANAAPNGPWDNATYRPVFTFGPAAGPAALNNQATVYFRIVDTSTVSANGGTVASGGTDRIDNVIITAAVPTPGTLALMGVGGLIAVRRRRA